MISEVEMDIKNIVTKGIKYCTDSDYRFAFNASRGKYNNMPDEEYLVKLFKAKLGYNLNLKNPATFNEKIQWLKLYDRNPIYTSMVDKYEAKNYVGKIIGFDHIINTIGVWNRFEDIDFEKLPERFVLKTTHGCGGIYICKDKAVFDKEKAANEINKTLCKNYYLYSREWPYKNVKPRVIAEEYIEETEDELKDYKFFCFNGKAKVFKVDFDRFTDHFANYYDIEGNLMPFGEAQYPPRPDRMINLPSNLERMIELAEILSKNIRFLRVDFYNVNNRILFGELTFSPDGGMGRFTSADWDRTLGGWLVL